MRNQFVLGAIVAGVLCLGIGMTTHMTAADAADAKNLKVLPANTPKKEIKKIMKGISDALGENCDFCHDLDDMSSDKNEHKVVAREMMKMTAELNKKHFKGKPRVTCMTCHNGKKEPK